MHLTLRGQIIHRVYERTHFFACWSDHIVFQFGQEDPMLWRDEREYGACGDEPSQRYCEMARDLTIYIRCSERSLPILVA